MFCFLFNLHYVAILSAAKLSNFFYPLIHQREMTAGHYSIHPVKKYTVYHLQIREINFKILQLDTFLLSSKYIWVYLNMRENNMQDGSNGYIYHIDPIL
jgi:hypothetical protein